ncbi:MAG: Ig-like domain-containing protein [Patescibacteria group bacterium]
MRRNYSRLARVEEKKSLQTAVIFGVLSVVVLIAFIFLGIPAMASLANFVGNVKNGNKTSFVNDGVAPAAPIFNTLPSFVSKEDLTVSGTTEAGAMVTIHVNDSDTQVETDTNGKFETEVNLQRGENTIFATAKDTDGNTSEESKAIKIILDTESPDLTITLPANNSSFFGSKQKELNMEGTTDSGATVTVNNKIASIDESGKFKTTISLSNGDNQIVVKSTDQSGNTTEKTLFVSFSE